MHLRTLLISLIFLSFFGQTFAQIKLVGHRGAAKYAPENTIASCAKAIELGADYIEMDIRQTKDGVYVLMHDNTVNRTTNGEGPVEEMMWSEVQKLDAGSHFSKDFAGEKVPSLRQVLQFIKGKCLPDLDIKLCEAEGLVKLLEEEGFLESGEVLLHSGSREFNKEILALTDKILIRPGAPKKDPDRTEFFNALNPPIVNINWWNFSKKWVQTIHDEGRMAFVNTLHFDKKRNMRKAIRAGADFIQTDKLPKLKAVLQEFEEEK